MIDLQPDHRQSGAIELWNVSDLERFPCSRVLPVLATEFHRTGELSKYLDSVSSIAYSPTGRTIATGGSDEQLNGVICLWEVPEGRLVRRINAGRSTVNHVSFHPDVKLLSSVGSRVTSLFGIRLQVEVSDSLKLDDIRRPSDTVVHVWNIDEGVQYAQLRGHTGDVNAAVFSPDGEILASASSDGTVRLWGVSSKRLVRTIHGESGAV